MRSKEIIKKWRNPNDGTRTLLESILVPEIQSAINDWTNNYTSIDKNLVLIGGLALSYWNIPRETQDVDILFITDDSIPTVVNGFKKHRSHAFEHNDTGIEIETLSPEFLNISKKIVSEVINNSVVENNIRIATPSGLVALKLHRNDFQDKAGIAALIKNYNINLNDYTIDKDKLLVYNYILNQTEK